MIILSKCVRKLKRLNSFDLWDKILLIRVFLLTGIFRMIMLYVPFNKLKSHMGTLNLESAENEDESVYVQVSRIAWAIRTIVKYTPWQSKCLVQSLTAQYLITKKHIACTLYLGVSKEKILNSDSKSTDLIAHSWIRCGNYFVTGGNGNNFAVVAKFSK